MAGKKPFKSFKPFKRFEQLKRFERLHYPGMRFFVQPLCMLTLTEVTIHFIPLFRGEVIVNHAPDSLYHSSG